MTHTLFMAWVAYQQSRLGKSTYRIWVVPKNKKIYQKYNFINFKKTYIVSLSFKNHSSEMIMNAKKSKVESNVPYLQNRLQ